MPGRKKDYGPATAALAARLRRLRPARRFVVPALLAAVLPFGMVADAADPPFLPLGLQFVPSDFGIESTSAGRLSVRDSLASIEAGSEALPRAVRRPDRGEAGETADGTGPDSGPLDTGTQVAEARPGSLRIGKVQTFDAQVAQGIHSRRGPRGGQSLSPRVTQEIQVVDPERGETVLSRERPEYDPLGLPLGGFTAFPSLAAQERFTDNVFRSDGNEKADLITNLQPNLVVRSNWSVHALTFEVGGDIGIHADNGSEDYEDARIGAAGRLDIDSETYIGAGANFQKRHEDRGSPDDVAGREPTEYNAKTANLEIFRSLGNLRATVGGQVESINYHDADAVVGGALVEINNDDRDRNVYKASGKLQYQFLPETGAFIRGTGNLRDYKNGVDDNGFNRDSTGFGVDAGVEMDFGGLIFGDVFVGYQEQDYDSGALSDRSGVRFGADVTWNVTPLTTIVASASQSIEETTLAGASGFTASRGALSVDHELLRNVLILLDGSFQRNDYEGISREDDIVFAGAEARYLVNRNVYVAGAYQFRNRDSDGGADFMENTGLVRVGLQY